MNGLIRIADATGNERLAKAAPQRTLAQVLFLEGLWPARPFCAGLGRCGLCAVQFGPPMPPVSAVEEATLPTHLLAQGWRLACRRQAEAGVRVELPFAFHAVGEHGPPVALDREPKGLISLAVDLGTTSLHWRVDDDRGCVGLGQGLNPQLAAGSEVMSRVGFALEAPGNARVLRDVVRQWIGHVAAAQPAAAGRLCVAGNTVMTALLLGWPLSGLAAAPYTLPHPGGLSALLGPDGPEAYIPPMLAPFIGADVSAGLAHVHFSIGPGLQYPFLFADLGTNGEFILALGPGDRPGDCLGASVPLGPALEGIGMVHGAAALPGAWVDFTLSADGLTPVVLPGKASSDVQSGARISGTGYLGLLACLRGLGLLDRTGRFTPGDTPLARRIGRFLEDEGGERRLDLGQGVFLTARDVEELLKVKAAFNLALSRLLEEAGIAPGALRAVWLAGALGEHVRPAALETLGFVPPGMSARIRPLGNASLAGAALLARSGRAREWVEAFAPRVRTLSLNRDDFFAQFIQRLVFDHVS